VKGKNRKMAFGEIFIVYKFIELQKMSVSLVSICSVLTKYG